VRFLQRGGKSSNIRRQIAAIANSGTIDAVMGSREGPFKVTAIQPTHLTSPSL
jgi:hypothetical protein